MRLVVDREGGGDLMKPDLGLRLQRAGHRGRFVFDRATITMVGGLSAMRYGMTERAFMWTMCRVIQADGTLGEQTC